MKKYISIFTALAIASACSATFCAEAETNSVIANSSSQAVESSSTTQNAEDSKAQILSIDTPDNGKINIGSTLIVTGYSLNHFGVKDISVYLDDKLLGNAECGIASPEVNKAKNSDGYYKDGETAGFKFTLNDTSSIKEGTHTIKVVAKDNSGATLNATAAAEKAATKKFYTMAVAAPRQASSASPCMSIDSVRDGRVINGDLSVSGWSLSSSGVKKVQYYIDGNYICDATTGYSRPDVDAACNQSGAYLDADKSGYRGTIPASKLNTLSGGDHTLKVISIGNDGVECADSVRICKVSLNPRITIDSVSDGRIVNGDLSVSGWSLSSSGVKKVQYYIDGKYICDATVGYSRPDVDAACNQSGGYLDADKSGYRGTISASIINALSGGNHTLKVVSVGNDGVECASSVTVCRKTLNPQLAIDSVSNGRIINGDLSVSGWSLSSSGVKKVSYYIDGKYICDATVGYSRPDVDAACNQSGGYLNADKSGYRGTIPASTINTLSSGNHTLKVVSVGNDGVECASSVTVCRKTLNPQIAIDSVSNGKIVNGDLSVSGWSLSSSGVKKVSYYIDGKYICDATVGYSRPDVDAACNQSGGYLDADKSGYRGTISASIINALSGGNHTLKVVSFGNDGVECTGSVTVCRKVLNPQLTVDSVSNGQVVNGNLSVSGWSLSSSGVKKVQYYIDGKYICDADVGYSRPDVDAACNQSGGYLDADKSGYRGTITASQLSAYPNGNHTLKVVSIGNDGVECSREVAFCKKTPNPQLCIDSVSSGKVISGDLDVSGWSLSASGVKKVQYYIDGKYVGDAEVGFARPDVNAACNKDGGYKDADKSGFEGTITKDKLISLSSGDHTLKVVSIGNDDVEVSSTVTIKRSILTPHVTIDTPANGTVIKGETSDLSVSGWSLSSYGVKKVQYYIDGTYICDAEIGYSRPDVNSACNKNGGYVDADKSGYRGTIPASKLSALTDGEHTLKVVSIGNDGTQCAKSITIVNALYPQGTYRTDYNVTAAEMLDKYNTWATQNKYNNVDINYIDPDKVIDTWNAGIYQFMKLDYNGGITAEQMNKMLEGKGVLAGQGAAFIKAAETYNINPVYLAAHARVESGNGTSTLSTGVKIDGVTYYNQYGIGAIDSNPVNGGGGYAKNKGWDTVEKSIIGGAKWISDIYVHGGKPDQDTLYEMRFDPGYFDGTYQKAYCYATDRNWANSIASIIYQNRDILKSTTVKFDIPRYK